LTVEYPFRASDGALWQPCPRSPAVGYRTARSPQDRDVCQPRDCGDSPRLLAGRRAGHDPVSAWPQHASADRTELRRRAAHSTSGTR